MAYHYTLTPLLSDGRSFRVNHTKGDIVKSSLVRFEYGVVYETNDEALVTSLRRLTQRFPNNASNRDMLESHGVSYDIVPCQSCGGRVLKLEVHLFDIKEV